MADGDVRKIVPFFQTAMIARAKDIDDEDGDDYVFIVDVFWAATETSAIKKLKRKWCGGLASAFPDVSFDSEGAERCSMLQWLVRKLRD